MSGYASHPNQVKKEHVEDGQSPAGGPGKQNHDITQNPGALQAAAVNGMSPLSLMEANKPAAGEAENPMLARMYPSAKPTLKNSPMDR